MQQPPWVFFLLFSFHFLDTGASDREARRKAREEARRLEEERERAEAAEREEARRKRAEERAAQSRQLVQIIC